MQSSKFAVLLLWTTDVAAIYEDWNKIKESSKCFIWPTRVCLLQIAMLLLWAGNVRWETILPICTKWHGIQTRVPWCKDDYATYWTTLTCLKCTGTLMGNPNPLSNIKTWPNYYKTIRCFIFLKKKKLKRDWFILFALFLNINYRYHTRGPLKEANGDSIFQWQYQILGKVNW